MTTVYALVMTLMAGVRILTPDGVGTIPGVQVQYEYMGTGAIKFSPGEFDSYEECKKVEQAVLTHLRGSVIMSGCVKRVKE